MISYVKTIYNSDSSSVEEHIEGEVEDVIELLRYLDEECLCENVLYDNTVTWEDDTMVMNPK